MLSLIRGEVREKGGKKGEERWKRGRGEKGRKSIWPGQIMSSVTLRVSALKTTISTNMWE